MLECVRCFDMYVCSQSVKSLESVDVMHSCLAHFGTHITTDYAKNRHSVALFLITYNNNELDAYVILYCSVWTLSLFTVSVSTICNGHSFVCAYSCVLYAVLKYFGKYFWVIFIVHILNRYWQKKRFVCVCVCPGRAQQKTQFIAS